MKLSKYNIIKKIDENTLIYNTITSGVLMLNKEYSYYFNKFIKTGICEKKDLINELIKGNMVIDDNINELETLELMNKIQRFSDKNLILTIAPTLNCNFACPYCYEGEYRHSKMTESTKKDLIKFLDNYNHIQNLGISWYGGEPLLEINTIEKLTEDILKTLPKINYSANIVTNGYLLSKENVLRLKKAKVKHIQVTLDGPKEIHDKRRVLLNGKGSFDVILNNIKECCEIVPISIRINVDKENINEVYSLVELLGENNLLDKVGFYLAPVDNSNNTCKNNSCFTMKDFSEEEIKFYEKCLENGIKKISIPSMNLGICGAVSKNSFVISPNGDLYKCWNEIGRKEFCVGNLSSKITVNTRLAKWLLFNPLKEYEECKECSFLPVCFGGCAYNYMQNIEKKCNPIIFNSDKTIELLYLSKAK